MAHVLHAVLVSSKLRSDNLVSLQKPGFDIYNKSITIEQAHKWLFYILIVTELIVTEQS